MLTAILGILGPIFGSVAKSVFPDPADELKRQDLQNQLVNKVIEAGSALEQAAAAIIKAEAASSHWLAANWRPITALIFVGLIVARWMGFAAPGMTEAEYLKVYELIYIMIGGYTIARSVEKTAPSIAAAITGKRK